MRNILKLLYKFHFFLLFVAFEILSLIFIVQNNNYQRASYIQLSNSVSGRIFQGIDNFKVYFSLREANELLSKENEELRNKLTTFRKVIHEKKDTLLDTTFKQRYTYMSAKVVNSSVSKQYNYITLNKGSEDGVKPDMSVISPKGIVGVVTGVSSHFATVLPVINRNFKLSAKLKKSNFFGPLSWPGLNPEICMLNDIPHHVQIHKGDTVITTGYSGVFPEGIPIATVKEFEIKDGNFYIIKLQLTTDFRSLNYVTIVGDLQKLEQMDLEKRLQHD
jgi:rod shape-determining protein MreC